jgi:cell division protein FtsL
MAAAAAVMSNAGPAAERRSLWTGTPEIYFSKQLDNSRLVKVEDVRRNREMRYFVGSLAFLLLLVFTYTWQHFKAIEYGYQIEQAKRELGNLNDSNRELRLEDASLRDPERIDMLARRIGLVPPEPGQVNRLDTASSEGQGPVMADNIPRIALKR